MQLLSNDEGVDGFSWKNEELAVVRNEMDAMLDKYPDTVISSKYYHEIITTGKDAGPALRLERVPLGDQAAGQARSPAEAAHRVHPLGRGPENHAPLLHLRDQGLLHLQGRRGPHELGHGEQAGPHALDQRPPELDRGVRDVRKAVQVYSVVIAGGSLTSSMLPLRGALIHEGDEAIFTMMTNILYDSGSCFSQDKADRIGALAMT